MLRHSTSTFHRWKTLSLCGCTRLTVHQTFTDNQYTTPRRHYNTNKWPSIVFLDHPKSLKFQKQIPLLSGVRYYARRSKDDDATSVFKALPVKPIEDPDGINVGEELAGELKKKDLLKILNKFYNESQVKLVAAENGIDDRLFHQTFVNFRRFCTESKALPPDLHVVLSDILQNAGHVSDILPYFIKHSKIMFPHLECMEDLQQISDLRRPANWYHEARSHQRKIIYHAGPTNSGKTYHALERFNSAKSGVYCGPLRLLANEVFRKTNDMGTSCDLVTGEERNCSRADGEPSNHVSCTVEMLNTNVQYEVAIIDEIQMIRDRGRGWAWTRAFLGACCHELHVCGEGTAIDLLRELALEIGDVFEVRKYKRLTPFTLETESVEDFEHITPGDCIVCFSKNDIYHCSRQLERRGMNAAVIYGTLPPGTKVAQSAKFNDPDDPCNVMIATDAIGMGLNLNIKRIVFYSLMRPTINEKGEKEFDVIPVSQAKQIAGRAGRYNTAYADGRVTTFKSHDLPILTKLLGSEIEDIEQAGLNPTAEQIELFAYHLPKATLSNLIDIFVTVSQLDNERYFLCKVEDFKFLADMIEHIPLQLRNRYVFCCAPIANSKPFVCTMFLKFARQFSREEPATWEWLARQIQWPFTVPRVIKDQVHLESVFDVLDLYLWLSYRFVDMFPDVVTVREMQQELDAIIQSGVSNLTKLLRNTESPTSSQISSQIDDGDEFELSHIPRQPVTGKQKITDQLVETGVLTQDTVEKIKREIIREITKKKKPK